MYKYTGGHHIIVWFFLISPLLQTGNGASGRWRRRGFDNEKKMSVLLSSRTSARPGDEYFPFLNGFIIISYNNNNNKNVNRDKNKEMSHFYRFYLNAFCDAIPAPRIVQSIIYNDGIHSIYVCVCVHFGRFYNIKIAILIHTLIYVYVCVCVCVCNTIIIKIYIY